MSNPTIDTAKHICGRCIYSVQCACWVPVLGLLMLAAWPWWLLTGHNYLRDRYPPFKWMRKFTNRDSYE